MSRNAGRSHCQSPFGGALVNRAIRRSQRTLQGGAGNAKGIWKEIILDLLVQVEDFVDPNGKISLQREETPSNR